MGPEGVVATYRKRNLVGTTPARFVFTPGTESHLVEAGVLRVSLAVCWDMGFPGVAREAALGGADLILDPAAWREPSVGLPVRSLVRRALDSGVYVASVNQSGTYPEASLATPGHVYGPDGTRVSLPSGTTSMGTVDPATSLRWRARYGNTLVKGVDEEPLEIVS